MGFKIHICMFTKTDNLPNLSKEGYLLFFYKKSYMLEINTISTLNNREIKMNYYDKKF